MQFSEVILFNDGAPTPYKNRINFADCSFTPFDFGVQTECHYFGSRHGKGPCDREIGVVKKTVNHCVKARQTNVTSAEDFFSVVTDCPYHSLKTITTATRDRDFCMCNAEMCTEIGLTASDCS